MDEHMKAHGKTIICMDKEFIHGVMVGNTKENTTWTRNMAMEYTSGQMGEDMKDIGQMEMYVRMYEDLHKIEGDNPTIGLILCSEKTEAVVK